MTVLRPTSPAPARTRASLEVAWTVSAGALLGRRTYAGAALHLECSWDPHTPGAPCQCTATIDRAGARSDVPLPGSAQVLVERHGRWVHLRITAASQTLLRASFESGRLAYCTSTVPAAAGLPGGTYDAPTGLLELYEPEHGG